MKTKNYKATAIKSKVLREPELAYGLQKDLKINTGLDFNNFKKIDIK